MKKRMAFVHPFFVPLQPEKKSNYGLKRYNGINWI